MRTVVAGHGDVEGRWDVEGGIPRVGVRDADVSGARRGTFIDFSVEIL